MASAESDSAAQEPRRRGWIPYASLDQASRVKAAPVGASADNHYDMTIEVSAVAAGGVRGGELAVRKVYTRVPAAVVEGSEKLLVLAGGGRSIRAVLDSEMVSPEGVERSLGWMEMSAAERDAWTGGLSWPTLVMLLDAARWLACDG